MRESQYRNILRKILAGILSSDISDSELKSLSQEIKYGKFSSDLARMLDIYLFEMNDTSKYHGEKTLLSKAEDIISNRKIPRRRIVNIIRSLLPASSSIPMRKMTRDMLEDFFEDASFEQSQKFLAILEAIEDDDEYLKGISERKE